MAPPPAADNFGQRQAITTAIKNICQYYPHNTCLRELLQNADDAGSTEIEYVLDTKTYTQEPLMSKGLKDFHGPALLARNNSIFRKEDFSSLSSIGDSIKAQDPASTGKFGQGFNAVYHWTDGPWIYSGKWLLFLDPHEWWSREVGQPGGPRWNVVDNANSVEVQNHMLTFSEFNLNWQTAPNQTIVRIPLRIKAQAMNSKLFKRKADIQEIEQALKDFGQELEEGGLLFLKHIRKVIIRIDGDVMLTAETLGATNADTQAREQLPMDFKSLYAFDKPLVTTTTDSLQQIFELGIRFTKQETFRVDRYIVSHVMLRSSGDAKMDRWAREQKLFPWAAVAALLKDAYDGDEFCGRLFTTLRLPMPTNLPLHVHGLFSIAPDRGRLSFTRGKDDPPTKWNNFMFTRCVTLAWLGLLVHRNSFSWHEEMFGFWPRPNFSPVEMWDKLDDSIIDEGVKCKHQIWNTLDERCVDIDHGLFAIKNAEAIQYGPALAQVHIPAVYMSEAMFKKVDERAKLRFQEMAKLAPKTTRQHLRSKGFPSVSEEVSSLVLEFCLLDAIRSQCEGTTRSQLYDDLHEIPFWPTISGPRSTSGNGGLLLPRDYDEMQLFSKSRATKTIDISKLRPSVRKLLLTDIDYLVAVMRFRGLADLAKDWPLIYSTKPDHKQNEDSILRLTDLDTLLSDVWAWISSRIHEGQTLHTKSWSALWLVPMSGCRIRQYRPCSKSSPLLIIEPCDSLHSALSAIICRTTAKVPPTLDNEVIPPAAVKLLRNHTLIRSDTKSTSPDHLDTFVDWLVVGKAIFSEAADLERNALLDHLENFTRESKLPRGLSSSTTTNLRRLPLYHKISCLPPFDHHVYTWCSLDGGDCLCETPSRLPPLPDIHKVSFFDPQSHAEATLIKRLKVLEKVNIRSLFSRYFSSWLGTVPSTVEDPLSLAKERLIDWLMLNIPRHHSEAWQVDVLHHPIIPLPVQNGEREYRSLSGMIDPDSSLARLYDPEERLFPCPDFFARHKDTLIMYGILSKVVVSTPLERATYWSKREFVDIHKVKSLLKLPVPWEPDKASVAQIRNLKWLPGQSVTGESTLLAPKECRGAEESNLVDMVWGTTAISTISTIWKKILGWSQPIDSKILIKQLDCCLSKKEYQKSNAVLLQLQLADCAFIRSRACILGRSGEYFTPTSVILPGSHLSLRPLAPYLDEIDSRFAGEHYTLIEGLGILPEPSLDDLRRVQRALVATSEDQVDSSSVRIAISVLEIATRLGYDPVDLLVPDTSSRLRQLEDIVHGELLCTGDTIDFNFTHPEVSADLTRRLGIENSLARAIRLEIDLGSEDEDDFTPSENLETVISDTLGRYPVTAMFNEFLANADDAGATTIAWVLDECSEGVHASSSLLTPELEPFQCSALFVYNNGVFSKTDFDGFKQIGQGGKMNDAASTGMFGRGALSMYHVTDVPMLVSSDSFLVIDPQQQVLPIDYARRRKRRVGTKLSMSVVNRLTPDQLAPFIGLYGFDPDADQYNGTLFRFPLRAAGTISSLKEAPHRIDHALLTSLLDEYFNTARTALLFLRHVKSIEFKIRGRQNAQWAVYAERSRCVDGDIFRRIEVTSYRNGLELHNDSWCVGLKNIHDIPAGVIRAGRGSKKSVECGIAACLIEGKSHKAENGQYIESILHEPTVHALRELMRQSDIQNKVFCRLPTTIESRLPVFFHASFAVTGDRKSIALEASAENSDWNQWLLTTCLSTLYLETVQYLAPRLGQLVYRFWPSKGSSTDLDGLLSRAFWDRLGSRDYETLDVFPLIAQDTPIGRRTSATLTQSSQKITNFKAAWFDFHPITTSKILQPVFMQLVPLLVRPPEELWTHIRAAASSHQTKQVDAECLGGLFKVEENCTILETFFAQFPSGKERSDVMALLLKTMVPEAQGASVNGLDYLDKCRILPRLDLGESLGTLVKNPGPSTTWHLLATPEEEKLFAFATDSMVNNGLFPKAAGAMSLGTFAHHDPVQTLLGGCFNVRSLSIEDIGPLLGRSDSPTASLNESDSLDDWMLKLWRFLNPKLRVLNKSVLRAAQFGENSIETLLGKAGLLDRAIFRIGSKGQPWRHITPREFEAQPCIVDPVDEWHRKICEQLPGLLIVDRDCVPFLLREQESNLSSHASFKRLLQAFQKLEATQGVDTKTFIGQALSLESKDGMQRLALNYLNSSTHKHDTSLQVLRKLPIWRRLRRSPFPPHEHIAADDALFSEYEPMLMPWVRDLSKFVRPDIFKSYKGEISRLENPLLTREQTWRVIQNDLPRDIKPIESRQQYLKFIQYLARWSIKVFGKVAPNGASIMCETNSLYDHKDEIFRAAFREQKNDKFLHQDMWLPELHHMWLSLGLRARSHGQMRQDHFLESALAINRRWDPANTTPDFEQDSAIVASYLKFDGDQFRSWAPITWAKIAAIPMFKAQDVSWDELRYRRSQIQSLAQIKTHRTLEDSSNLINKRIIWSQSSFLVDPPGQFVYSTLPRHGRPTSAQVFEHLLCLVSIINDVGNGDMAEFLRDIQACYEYLQDNLDTTKLIPGIHQARIWLNLNTTQVDLVSSSDLEGNLTSATSLCLSSPVDPLPIKVARKFLVPYEKLLLGLGCKAVEQPQSRAQPQTSDARELSLVESMAEMQRMREQNQLVDIMLVAEGQKKPAHRLVLAAVSDYCKAQFAGEWGRILEKQATVHLEDLSYLTLCQMVDFAYTGDFQWPELKDDSDNDEIATTLAMLLDLLVATDMWLLQRLHDMTENFLLSPPYSGIYIRVDTVDWVKDRAESARALRLVSYCEDFLTRNEEFVIALRDDRPAEG